MVQTLTAAAQECHHPEIQRQPSASGPMSPTSICAGVRTTMDHTKYFLSLLDRIIETNQVIIDVTESDLLYFPYKIISSQKEK